VVYPDSVGSFRNFAARSIGSRLILGSAGRARLFRTAALRPCGQNPLTHARSNNPVTQVRGFGDPHCR
jgi:hypothetical protein